MGFGAEQRVLEFGIDFRQRTRGGLWCWRCGSWKGSGDFRWVFLGDERGGSDLGIRCVLGSVRRESWF